LTRWQPHVIRTEACGVIDRTGIIRLRAREALLNKQTRSVTTDVSAPDRGTISRRLIVLTFVFALLPCHTLIASGADEPAVPDAGATGQPGSSVSEEPDNGNPSITLTGSVWRTKSGIVFVKTPIGMLTLSSKTTFKDLRASQDITLWVHDAHFVVDIRKRADGTLLHRYLSGPFTPDASGAKQLARWTPDGERSYHYGAQEQTLAAMHEGDSVTVEVDRDDTIVGMHNVQFDLQIGQIPAGGSDAHLLLSGTVSKLKSNFIFFRTPVGVVTVNAKIGIKNAKVGQSMTLHVHRQHVVADLALPNDAARTVRFVTGPLRYATPDRTSVMLWTPDGDQTFPTTKGKAALAGIKEGTPITVELDGQGAVAAFHRPQ
jgi:hypothetical protein